MGIGRYLVASDELDDKSHQEAKAQARDNGITVFVLNENVGAKAQIRVSLEGDRSAGKLTRLGVTWFFRQFLMQWPPKPPSELEAELDRSRKYADRVLKKSELLGDLDVTSPDDFREALRRLKGQGWTVELAAVILKAAAAVFPDAFETENARDAAWALQLVTNAHAMLLFLDQLEPLVWRGYQAYGVDALQKVLEVWQSNQATSSEAFWQELFDQYPFVVSQVLSYPVVMVRGKAYVGGKTVDDTGGQVVDYLLSHQLTNNAALLELKSPTTRLLGGRYRQGVYPPSRDLSGAVAQVAAQRDSLLRSSELLASDPHRLSAFNSHCIVVIGHTTELDDEPRKRSFELYRSHLAGVTVMTYDELFENVRGLLNIVEGP